MTLAAKFLSHYIGGRMVCNSKDCLLFTACVDVYGRSNNNKPPCAKLVEGQKPSTNTAMVQLLRDMHVELMRSSNAYAGTELPNSRLYAALEQQHH